MSKYTEIDQRIIDAIKSGVTRHHDILKVTGLDDRVVDRRKQALSQRGLIRFSTKSKRWEAL